MNHLINERLDLDPSAYNAAKEWIHWRRTFDNFIIECGIDPVPNKHRIITNMISANVYEHVEDCTDFQSVIDALDNLPAISSQLGVNSLEKHSMSIFRIFVSSVKTVSSRL